MEICCSHLLWSWWWKWFFHQISSFHQAWFFENPKSRKWEFRKLVFWKKWIFDNFDLLGETYLIPSQNSCTYARCIIVLHLDLLSLQWQKLCQLFTSFFHQLLLKWWWISTLTTLTLPYISLERSQHVQSITSNICSAGFILVVRIRSVGLGSRFIIIFWFFCIVFYLFINL